MKTQFMALASLALLSTFNSQISTAFGQGALTPPGAPAPTMKSLDQIEPRTPIAANTTPGDANDLYIISQPGSYYLTTNVIVTTNNYAGTGIKIMANNVTLDLNGFSLSCASTNNSTFGISIPNNQTNIIVRNGNVDGWWYGVSSISVYTANLVIEKLNVANCIKSGNGYGIAVNGAAVIRDCNLEDNGTGISCNSNVGPGSSVIADCKSDHNVYDGIDCSGGGIVSGCMVNNNGSVGINILFNQYGISPSDDYLVSKCTANNNVYGIYVQGARNRVEDNHVVNNSYYGIDIDNGGGPYTNNIIIRNSAEKSGFGNYNISGIQIAGPVITTTGTITNSNPWANFSF